jgi:hypothetical protein
MCSVWCAVTLLFHSIITLSLVKESILTHSASFSLVKSIDFPCGAGGGTQGLEHSRQALPLSYILIS